MAQDQPRERATPSGPSGAQGRGGEQARTCQGHTPGPWRVEPEEHWPEFDCRIRAGNWTICHVEPNPGPGSSQANAAYIVQACNAYPDLVAALEAIAKPEPIVVAEPAPGWIDGYLSALQLAGDIATKALQACRNPQGGAQND